MDNQNGNKDNNKNNKQGFSFVILITMLTALLVFAMYQFQGVDSDQEITYNKFLKMIDEKKVEKVEIKSDRILITAKKESGDKVNKEYYTGRMNDDQLVEKLEKAKIDFNQEVPEDLYRYFRSPSASFPEEPLPHPALLPLPVISHFHKP